MICALRPVAPQPAVKQAVPSSLTCRLRQQTLVTAVRLAARQGMVPKLNTVFGQRSCSDNKAEARSPKSILPIALKAPGLVGSSRLLAAPSRLQ
jgi:hypothetical protein